MTRSFSYNIPGSGNIKTLLFDHTVQCYDFLERYHHITKLKRINQLGRLRDVFPGAHHNRYEYVYLQWALVTELVKQKGNHGLGTRRDFYGKINGSSSFPTSAELLQCLILVCNIGYSESTFAGNRAWLALIQKNRRLKMSFKSGLPTLAGPIFEKIVNDFDFYNFNHLVSLFLLQRYKRTDDGHIDFLTRLLIGYLNRESDNIHKVRIWEFYNNIRRISFLTLDSFYSPVPFSLRLTSIVLSFDEYYEDMILRETGYSKALTELEIVLQNTVYLSPASIICTSKATRQIIDVLSLNVEDFYSHSSLKKLLQTNNNNSYLVEDPNWSFEQTLHLNFEKPKGFVSTVINDPVNLENGILNRIGKTKIELGLSFNPNRTTIKLSISNKQMEFKDRLSTSLKIGNEVKKFLNEFSSDYKNPHEISNSKEILTFLLKSVFGWQQRFIIDQKDNRYNPIFIEYGKANMEKAIQTYYDRVSPNLNKDDLFEISQLKETVQRFGYSGLMLCFVGATKVLSPNQTNLSAEFDGVLIFPNRKITEEFMYIIEVKNLTRGFTQAHKQLQSRLRQILPPEINWRLSKLNSHTALATLST